MKRTVLVVMAAMVLGVGAAAAQAAAAATGGVRVGVGAGLILPLSDYKTADKAGWIAGADATYWLASQPIGIRVEAGYSQTSEKAGVTPAHKTKIFGGGADVVYAFGARGDQIRPYILAGLGFYNAKIDVTGFASGSSTKVGFGGGAGAAFKVAAGGTRIFVEGKYTNLKVNGANLSFIPIRVGLRFGSK